MSLSKSTIDAATKNRLVKRRGSSVYIILFVSGKPHHFVPHYDEGNSDAFKHIGAAAGLTMWILITASLVTDHNLNRP
jgi:hypothetical protein